MNSQPVAGFNPDAPLCAAADYALPLLAGAERSVAATKSYLASLSAVAQLTAAWTGDAELQAALVRIRVAERRHREGPHRRG